MGPEDITKNRGTNGRSSGFLVDFSVFTDGTKLATVGAKFATFLNIGYGKIVTTREPDRLVRLTDVRTGRELATLTKTVGGINDEGNMTFSPDGKRVAFHGSGKIHVWRTETGDVLTISLLEQNHENHGELLNDDAMIDRLMMTQMLEEVTVLVFSPDGKKLVSGTAGGKVQIWDAETGTALAPLLAGQNLDDKKVHNNFKLTYQNPIKALAFSSTGASLAVGIGQKIRLLGSSQQPRLKGVPYGETRSLVFSPDDTVLIAGLINGRTRAMGSGNR